MALVNIKIEKVVVESDPEILKFIKETKESQNLIINKLNQIIMNNAEILAKLEEADQQTNEIAEDLADLIANSGVSPEVADRLNAHVEKLRGVASTHTPGGGSE